MVLPVDEEVAVERATQVRITKEVFDYLDRGTTAMAGAEMLNPVGEYHDPAFLAREQDALFRRLPLLVGHGSELAEPGDFVADDVSGVPVLVVRQADGSVKAFLNVCRHRGSKVVLEECGRRHNISCPYHGWTYRPDGSLLNVPQEDGFAGIDRSAYGLVELPVEERHGLVWVVPTPGAGIDVASFLGDLDAELAAYGLESYVTERTTVLRSGFNWKLVVDGFLEAYHIRYLHTASIGPYIRNSPVCFEPFGPHHRMVAIRASFDELVGRQADEVDPMPHIAVIYQVFPNTVLVWQSDHFETWTTYPVDGDVARSASKVTLLAPSAAAAEETEHWDKNWRVLMDTVLEEDFVVATAIQNGSSSGAQDHFTFGRNEPALQHFHAQLRAALGSS